jgi:hypothetical protein
VVSDAIANIFSSKVVGGLFALAFGAWAFALNSMSDKVLQAQADTRNEVILLKSQVAELRGSLVAIQLKQAEDLTLVRERQNGVLVRLERLEGHIDGGQPRQK